MVNFLRLHSLLVLSSLFIFASCSTYRANQDKALLHLSNGNSYYQNSSYPLALKEFLKANEYDNNNKNIHNSLGLTYFMREKYDLAAKHFKKALEIDPKFTDCRNNLARTYTELNKFNDAQKELDLVINDLTYNFADRAYINLGLNFFKQGKFQQAKNAFMKSLENQPDNCFAQTYLGRSYFELEDYSSASTNLDRAIEFCQKSLYDEPHFYSALTYYRLSNKKKALSRFEEIIKIYPNGKYREKSQGMIIILKKAD